MTSGMKIGLGAAAIIMALLLVTVDAKAAELPPPPPPLPPLPPQVPPGPPLPKPPTMIGDKMAVTTAPSTLMAEPGGTLPTTDNPLPSNVVVKVLSIGYSLPGRGDWSRILVPGSSAWILFDIEEDTIGYVPSEVLGDPAAWTPATI